MKKLLVLFVALIVPLAFAGRSPVNLVADTVTGGDGPAVQSIGSSDSAQPVSIVNWLIDEKGNVRVSNQVRDQVIVLADSLVTIPALGRTYESPWFSTRTLNVMYVHLPFANVQCYIDWRWSDAIPFSSQTFEPTNPYVSTYPWRIAGPEARIRCYNSSDDNVPLDFVAVYLRAE